MMASHPYGSFEEYSERFEEFFIMRREGGVIELRAHTGGGPLIFGPEAHQAWSKAWQAVGNDPANEVLILTGTGDQWSAGLDAEGFRRLYAEHHGDSIYEHMIYDSVKLLTNLLDLEIPTIAAINGPGHNTVIPLLCDISLCTEFATFYDIHFPSGGVPGDGLHSVFQELLGVKRAALALYTGARIDARNAFDLGLVSEVVAPEGLMARAWELAETIMRAPRPVRRMSHALIARPWRRRILDDQPLGVAVEGFGVLSEILGGRDIIDGIRSSDAR